MVRDLPGEHECEAFSAILETNVRFEGLAVPLRDLILHTLRVERVDDAQMTSVCDLHWSVRTHCVHWQHSEEDFFEPMLELMRPLLLAHGLALKLALLGYNGKGLGSRHHDRAEGVRVCISLFPDPNFPRIIRFFRNGVSGGGEGGEGSSAGRGGRKASHGYELSDNELYLATSLARGATGPTRVCDGQIKHKASPPPYDVILVMDFVPTGTGTLVEREESAIAAVVHILKVLASAALPETEAIDAVHLALKFALKASQFREGRFREHWVNVTRERIKKKREEHPKTAAERKRKKRSSLVSFLEKKKAKKQAAEEKQAKKQAAAEKLAAEKLREMLEKIPDHDIARALKCARPTSLLRLCKKYDISTVGLCADGAFDKLKEDYRLLLQGLKM